MSLVPSKEARKEIRAEGTRFVRLVQGVFRITETQTRQTALIDKQVLEIEALRHAVQTLQAREDVLLARAEAAAAKAAASIVTDLARRIGYIEGQADKRT
jgi:hypothetical protein